MANETILIAIGVLILVGIGVLIYFTVVNKSETHYDNSDNLKLQLEITKLLNDRMNELKEQQVKNHEADMKSMAEHQEKSLKSMAEHQEKTLKQMGEIQKQMVEISMVQKSLENVSTNVVKLSDILSNNQTRGRFGEVQLEMLLGNIFGETNKGLLYDTQYNLDPGSGLKPDVVIFIDGDERKQTVCIDSKFSIVGADELFDSTKHLTDTEVALKTNELRNALKNRIKETAKYIVRGKTIDYSVMFIPSDAIFIFVNSRMRDVFDYALSEHVVITCPATLPPLLNSFKVFQQDIKKTRDIQKTLDLMRKFEENFRRFEERWGKIDADIAKLSKDVNDFNITVGKIGNEFDEISNGKTAKLESYDSSQ